MPKNKKKKSIRRHRPFYKRPGFYFFLIIIVILAGFVFAKHLDDKYKTEKPEKTSETKETEKPAKKTEETEKTKKEETKPEEPSSSSPDGKTPVAYEGENANLSNSLTGVLSYINYSSEKLSLRVNIDQYLSSGTCQLILSDGERSLERTANILPEASTSTCEGFDIPASDLGSFAKGSLSITVNITSGDRTGTITGSV